MAMELRVAEGTRGVELGYRLIEWPSRALVWSNREPVDSANPLAALTALAERTAVAILPALERHALAAASPLSGEGWRRYLACREQILFLEDHDVARSVATELEALVTAHPAFLAARPPLIRLYNTDYFYTRAGTSGPAERARAFELARDMVRRDPLLGHGWVVLGWGHLWRREWQQAEDALERAVELNPHHPQRLCEAAFGLLHLDRVERCAVLLERARAIAGHPDPMWWGDYGILLFVEGRAAEAHVALGSGLQSFIWTHVFRLAAAVESEFDPRPDAETLGARLSVMFGGRLPNRNMLFRWLSISGQPFRGDAVLARLRAALEQGLDLT
jgi:tetratricopeptide (TPR) repeat protein